VTVDEFPGGLRELRPGKPVPHSKSEASEGCRAEVQRKMAGRATFPQNVEQRMARLISLKYRNSLSVSTKGFVQNGFS